MGKSENSTFQGPFTADKSRGGLLGLGRPLLTHSRDPRQFRRAWGLFFSIALPRGRAVHTLLIPLTGTILPTPCPGDFGDPQASASASAWPGTGHSWGKPASF